MAAGLRATGFWLWPWLACCRLVRRLCRRGRLFSADTGAFEPAAARGRPAPCWRSPRRGGLGRGTGGRFAAGLAAALAGDFAAGLAAGWRQSWVPAFAGALSALAAEALVVEARGLAAAGGRPPARCCRLGWLLTALQRLVCSIGNLTDALRQLQAVLGVALELRQVIQRFALTGLQQGKGFFQFAESGTCLGLRLGLASAARLVQLGPGLGQLVLRLAALLLQLGERALGVLDRLAAGLVQMFDKAVESCCNRCSGVVTDFFFAGMKVPPGRNGALDGPPGGRQGRSVAPAAAGGSVLRPEQPLACALYAAPIRQSSSSKRSCRSCFFSSSARPGLPRQSPFRNDR